MHIQGKNLTVWSSSDYFLIGYLKIEFMFVNNVTSQDRFYFICFYWNTIWQYNFDLTLS